MECLSSLKQMTNKEFLLLTKQTVSLGTTDRPKVREPGPAIKLSFFIHKNKQKKTNNQFQ